MRIIKLSPKDGEMSSREMVDKYFRCVLHKRTPEGKFLLTRGRIAEDEIQPDEQIVFTYLGEIVYQAKARTGRCPNLDQFDSTQYPHYFCVDLKTIKEGCGTLHELEEELKRSKLIPLHQNLVKSQGWPIIRDADEILLSKVLLRFLK